MSVMVLALAGGTVEVNDEALDGLRMSVRGDVILPGDAALAGVRPVYNAMYPGSPGLVVRPSGTADVVDAVNFARDHGLVVAVRGGGHSVAGLSSIDGGMLIDLANMNGVEVDTDAGLAHVQGGALWGDVDRETQLHGLVAPGGVVSDTGVAGLALGGGEGWVRRKYGLTCDNMVSARVVTADGQVRTASADVNPDLFWAIRGGGGNFGVATSLTFSVHPLGPIVAFTGAFYPASDAAKVLRAYGDWARTAPNEITTLCGCTTLPAHPGLPPQIHNTPFVVVGGVYCGGVEEGMAAMQPLRQFAEPLVDISQPLPFGAVQSAFDPFFARQDLRSYWKSTFLADMSDGAVEIIARRAQSRPSDRTFVVVFHMGGAVNDVAADATAFSERSASFMVSIDGNWTDPAEDSNVVSWVREAWSELAAIGTGGVYLNFTSLVDEGPTTAVDRGLGGNLSRLAAIKAKYDPTNLFRRNNNILPAS